VIQKKPRLTSYRIFDWKKSHYVM